MEYEGKRKLLPQQNLFLFKKKIIDMEYFKTSVSVFHLINNIINLLDIMNTQALI